MCAFPRLGAHIHRRISSSLGQAGDGACPQPRQLLEAAPSLRTSQQSALRRGQAKGSSRARVTGQQKAELEQSTCHRRTKSRAHDTKHALPIRRVTVRVMSIQKSAILCTCLAQDDSECPRQKPVQTKHVSLVLTQGRVRDRCVLDEFFANSQPR